MFVDIPSCYGEFRRRILYVFFDVVSKLGLALTARLRGYSHGSLVCHVVNGIAGSAMSQRACFGFQLVEHDPHIQGVIAEEESVAGRCV